MTDKHPWHTEYEDFGIDQSLEPYPEQSVHQFFTDAADFHPEQGIVQHDQHFSYEQLQNDVTALAAALQEREIGPGDRVATVLPTVGASGEVEWPPEVIAEVNCQSSTHKTPYMALANQAYSAYPTAEAVGIAPAPQYNCLSLVRTPLR